MTNCPMQAFFNKSSQLPLSGFSTNVHSPHVSDETVEAMFWDIYAQGNIEKINQALSILRNSRRKEYSAKEIEDYVQSDQEFPVTITEIN